MLNYFKKPAAPAAPRQSPAIKRQEAAAAAQAQAQLREQARADAKAKATEEARLTWAPQLQAALGDDAALLRVARETPLVEVKLAAVQALAGEDALKQAEREFRSHDRRVHRAAKQRLDAAVAQRESRAQAQIVIDAARTLSAESPIPANRLVALDRAWQVLNADMLEPQQRSEFASWRERLNDSVRERGEQEQQVQRWIADVKVELGELQRACALPGVDDDAELLSRRCVAAQALRDSRIDVVLTAVLDQTLQVALQSAEQTLARWAEPPLADLQPAVEVMQPAAPAVAPAPPRTLSGEQRQALETLLQQAETAFAEGQLGVMQEQLEAIDTLLATFHGIRPSDVLNGRVQALHAESGRLKGWQQWGGGRARDDLVNEAEALARFTLAARPQTPAVPPPLPQDDTSPVPAAQEAPVGPARARIAGVPKLRLKAHGDAIQDMRRRWKELDRLGAPANQTLWKRFDIALETAHEPVAAQLAALKAQRQTNLAAREALLAELEARPAQPSSEDVEAIASFWKDQAHALENFQRAWRPLGPLEHTVPSGARNALLQRLNTSVERIEAPLQAARGVAEGVRQQLIERAEALVEELRRQPQLRDIFSRVRDLQAQWQHSARQLTLQRGVESALWARFKAATDGVFTQRDSAANARDAELTANLAAREALLQRLEALSSATPTADIERALAEVDRAWRVAGEPPRGTLNALETRLQKAHAAALHALSASGQASWQAICDSVAARLALCEEREAVPADDAGLVQRWAAQDALSAKLPAAWQQALAQRWSLTAQAAPLTDSAFDELLTHLEASLDLPATPERMTARRALKLRALKDTLEGRGAPAIDGAKRALWLATLLRSRSSNAALRERLQTLIAALRAASPGTLVAPAGKA